MIIYVWKILESQVPNFTYQTKGGITSQRHPRFGQTCCRTVEATGQRMKTIMSTSFMYEGPRLFICLPRDIRDTTFCTTDTFKKRLDKYLQGIPDEPPILHTATPRGAVSNSLPDQIKYLRSGGQCRGSGLSSWPW